MVKINKHNLSNMFTENKATQNQQDVSVETNGTGSAPVNSFETNVNQFAEELIGTNEESKNGIKIASKMQIIQVDIDSMKDSIDQLTSAFSTEISDLKEKIGKLSLIDYVNESNIWFIKLSYGK